MKLKIPKPVVVLIACVAGAVLCFGVFYLVDTYFNGAFVDWFEENFFIQSEYLPEAGQEVLVREPLWSRVKVLLLTVSLSAVVLWLLTVFLSSFLYARSRVKKTITSVCRMMHGYMTQEKESTAYFPKEYAEISAQMAEIRSAMQRNAQLLKDEASRKNDLITYLAHDLKTPLTSVIGYLSLLDEAPDMPAPQKEKYIHIALEKADRLEKLINEFFEITRYNLQQIDCEKETIDLCYMLVQMTDEFYPLLNAHGNTIEMRVEENITVYGDAEKLARVFNNVLKNAIAYSYPDTLIEVWAETTSDRVQVSFCNRGKTIPAVKLKSIFEKFFRLDEARTTNTGGAGLGLAIAKEIVTLHGGSITAKSENELTTFCVSLPLKA